MTGYKLLLLYLVPISYLEILPQFLNLLSVISIVIHTNLELS